MSDELPEREECAEIGETCLCFNLRKTSRAITQHYDDALRASGLRSTQFALLAVLRLHAPITLSSLAEVTGMDRSTVSRNLKPLERGRYVVVEAGDDRRTREAKLTRRGGRVLTSGMPLWRQAQDELQRIIGKSGMVRLLDGLSDAESAARAQRG